MGENVYPCIVYQRLRPSAPKASQLASRHVWPLTDELVELEGYTPCGLYGDSEFAPPFCGGWEIRPGFEAALAHARRIAAKLGTCTLLIGDASPLGDADPFLPPLEPSLAEGRVHIRIVNFHLRPQARSTSLRSAWRYVEEYRQSEDQAAPRQIAIGPSCEEIELLVVRNSERGLARIYLANPASMPLEAQWRQLVRSLAPGEGKLSTEWSAIVVAPRCAAYVDTILQGGLPWTRQLTFKCDMDDRKMRGTAQLGPSDMSRDKVLLVWETRG